MLEKKEKNLMLILIKFKIFRVLLIICLGWFVIFNKLMELIVKLWKIWKEKNRYGKCILMKRESMSDILVNINIILHVSISLVNILT